jgi:hypothetical protein
MESISRFQKNLIISISLVSLLCTLTGCRYKGYQGEYPALYTEAVNTLLAMSGVHSHGDAIIKVVEEDPYGRILFSYFDDTYISEEYPESFCYLICQKIDESYVYFYTDNNFIIDKQITADAPFSEEEIELLKTWNDWGEKINEQKLVKYEISRFFPRPKVQIEEEVFEELFLNLAKDEIPLESGTTVFTYPNHLTSDTYDRSLYYVLRDHVIYTDKNREVTTYRYVLMLNPDGSYDEATCLIPIYDFYNYQDLLREFKEINGWNMPFPERG